jgi:hypothetical protein
MKKLTSLIAALTLTSAATPSFAGDTNAASEKRPQSAPRMMDCSKLDNPEKKANCEAHQKAYDLCKDKSGAEAEQCMKDAKAKKAK